MAEVFDIRKAGRMVVAVRDVLDEWESFARDAEVAPDKVAQIRTELDARAQQLGG